MMPYNGHMRNPFVVQILCLLTFGAYGIYWHWQVNEELRGRGVEVSPATAALAVSWGAFLAVPPFVSCFRTARRVRSLSDDGPGTVGTIVSLVLFVYPAFLQSHLNKVVTRSS